ncbi:MAG: PaeR7I family type II restriction endonuclease, partial [Planctomycetota bacterium]
MTFDLPRRLSYPAHMLLSPKQLRVEVTKAVAHFWRTRSGQATAQTRRGKADQGSRAEVTGGAQMDKFVDLLASLVH